MLRITPDYRMSGTAERPLAELMTEVELVSFTADPEMPPERLAALRAELGRSMARIRNDVPRFLTDKETETLLETGLLRLPLSDFRGESVFSHHALFDKPTTFLSLRPYAEARLRFVALGEDGRIAVLRRITPYQPFRVEVIYTARPRRAPVSVEVAVGRQRLRVALSPVPGDARLFRGDEILPWPDPSLEVEKPGEPELADDPDHPDLGMPVLAGDPAASAQKGAGEVPEESAGEPVAETAPATGGGGERITGLPVLNPGAAGREPFGGALVNVAPERLTVPGPGEAFPGRVSPDPPGDLGGPAGVAVAPVGATESDVASTLAQQPRGGIFDPGSWRYIQPMTLAPEPPSSGIAPLPDLAPIAEGTAEAVRNGPGGSEATTIPRPGSSLRRQPAGPGAEARITAGITDTRITVGAGGGRPGVSAPRRVASPLLRLLDMLGLEDPRLQPLLADGVQLSDEIAAQELLRELAAERAGATEGRP